MTLKAVLDNLDDIPEALKIEYKEKDGKFYLDLDDTIKIHTAILPLSNTLTTQKTKITTLSAENTALKAKTVGLPDDFDPSKYQDIVTELDALKLDPNRDKDSEKKLQTAREQYEQRITALEAKRVADIAAKDAEISERDGTINQIIVDDGLTKALVGAGVGKEFLKASSAMLKPSVKIIRDEETGKRSPVVESDLGELPLEQFVENWSKSDEGKPFVKNPTGTGAPGNTGGTGKNEANPWDPKTHNLTQQGSIIRADKLKAERLMKAAGIDPQQIRQTLGQ